VADFRDEWSQNPEAGPQPWPTGRLARALERRVADAADAIVVTSDAAQIAGAPPGHPKRVTITNGVDPDDALPPSPRARSERFRISNVGTMYSGRDGRPILDSLARLAERGEIDPARVEFRIVGNVWLAEQPSAGAVPVVKAGYVDHAAAVREMGEADVLVAHLPSESHAIPGKLFEYLAARRPILAVMNPETPGFRIVAELDAGEALAPDDAAGIDAAIKARYDAWDAGEQGVPAASWDEVLRRFGREKLAGDLAALLDRLVHDREQVGPQLRDGGQEPGGEE
jgi:glycosyltransferase involved in cell wall biosynthesis